MRVSILTPTLNAERYFPECLRSVRAQTYPAERIQHLVLDGASADRTVELARAAGSEVSSQEDGGLYEAMNRGIRLAAGDVIGWLNADDTYEPGAIQAVVEAFRRGAGAEVVVGDYRMSSAGRSRIVRGRSDALERLRAGERRGAWVAPIATFYRAEVLRALGEYRTEYRICSDLDFWLRTAARTPPLRAVHAGAVLGTFRVHADSLSSGTSMIRSARESADIGLRWAHDPAAPAGVRRHALYLHRRNTYLARMWEAAPRGLPARVVAGVHCYLELQRLGPSALGDILAAHFR